MTIDIGKSVNVVRESVNLLSGYRTDSPIFAILYARNFLIDGGATASFFYGSLKPQRGFE